MSYFLENEEAVKEQEILQDETSVQQENEQDGIASIEPLLDNRIVRAIREMGFEKLSPIQEQAIPYLLQGEDIIGQAQTGTGKTAAFGIPAIQHINPDVKKLQTIILCPTRELAIQAAEELRKIAKYMHGIKVLPVYGGQDISRQIAGLRGVQIIVGTPGRVMDHMRRHTIKLDLVNMVVLDEADEMLNMGFREDMELILGQIPGEHQTALFSATMPKPILEITDRFQKDAKLVKVAAKELTIPLVSQKFYRVKNQDKDAACVRLLEYYQPKLTLIFCNTKKKVDELADLLKQQGFQAEGLHGDLSQAQRDVAMNRFRNGGASILIAMWQPEGLMWMMWKRSSTMTFHRILSITCTVSAEPGVPAERADPLRLQTAERSTRFVRSRESAIPRSPRKSFPERRRYSRRKQTSI